MPQRTLCLIKPDAVERSLTGEIIAMIQAAGLTVKALKIIRLSFEQAGRFYEVHKGRPFYDDLCLYMSSGPITAALLEGDDAVAVYRKLMGATNPADAEEGTIRKRFAQSIEANSVHGSDSPENAVGEIAFFFNALEIVG